VKNSRDFLLNKKEFYKICKQKCYLCGKENSDFHKNGIDRLENSICYIKNNCIGCCYDCNMIKKNYKYKDLIKKCYDIKQFQVNNKLHLKKSKNDKSKEIII
jgi:hypothetical protein